jgi:hypothetical protein
MIDCLHFRKQCGREGLDAADTLLLRFHLTVCEPCQDYDQRMRAERSLEALSAGEESPTAQQIPIT